MDPQPLSLFPASECNECFLASLRFLSSPIFLFTSTNRSPSTVDVCDTLHLQNKSRLCINNEPFETAFERNDVETTRCDATRRDERGQRSLDGAPVRPFFYLLLFSPVPLSFFSCDSLCSFWRTLAPFRRLYASRFCKSCRMCGTRDTSPRFKEQDNVWKYILSNSPK